MFSPDSFLFYVVLLPIIAIYAGLAIYVIAALRQRGRK